MNWQDNDPEDEKLIDEAEKLTRDVRKLMAPWIDEVDYDIIRPKLLRARRCISAVLITIEEGRDD